MERKVILATRKSPLALAQAGLVAAHLRRAGLDSELLTVVTTGDRQAEWSLEEKGGKGLFTKELEMALLRGDADLAIHSAKDLPGEASAGLVIGGYLPREDPSDVLVLRAGVGAPASLATGSPRRRMQVELLFPGVTFTQLRGNVDTRLRKITEQRVADGTVLAAAGIKRLGIASWPGAEFHALGFDSMVPAVGQGAIAVQCRESDAARWVGAFDASTALAVGLERAVQAALGGGCATALGAHVTHDTLYFFHETTGPRTFPIDQGDLRSPLEAARRILRAAGIQP